MTTVREQEKAERQKAIELVKAAEEAERDAIGITVAAQAEKKAAEDKAEAVTTMARTEMGVARAARDNPGHRLLMLARLLRSVRPVRRTWRCQTPESGRR